MNILKVIFLNIIITLLLIFFVFSTILIIELISGSFLKKSKLDCAYLHCSANYNYKNRSREHTLKENFNVFYNVNYVKDEYGFRGRRKEVSNIDIITVGGSTTDEKFLNLKNTWSEKLEEKFKSDGKDIDVVNAGIDGQSTFGHVWNLQNWFPKIKELKTNYIIFYMGINESFKNKASNKYDLEVNNTDFFGKIKFYIQRNNGFLYKIYNFLAKKYYNLYLNKGYNPIIPKYKELEKKIIPTDAEIENLRKNLGEIVKLSREIDTIPIFVTQKTLFWKKSNGKILIADVSGNYKDHYNFEKTAAETIVSFANENNVFVIDIFSDVEFYLDDFFELAHTTDKGSQKIADHIYKKINNEFNF